MVAGMRESRRAPDKNLPGKNWSITQVFLKKTPAAVVHINGA